MHLREINKGKTPIQLRSNLVFLVLVRSIPFVDGDYQCSTGIQNMAKQVQVLVYDTLPGINHQDDNIRIRNCLESFDNRERFYLFGNLAPSPDSCSINNGVGFSFTLIRDVDTVPGSASLIKNDYSVFTEQPIDQRGFTYIRTANYSYLDASGFLTRCSIILYLQSWFNFFVNELPNTDAITCRNKVRLADTQRIKLRRYKISVLAINFVDNQQSWNLVLAEHLGDIFIPGGSTIFCINQE